MSRPDVLRIAAARDRMELALKRQFVYADEWPDLTLALAALGIQAEHQHVAGDALLDLYEAARAHGGALVMYLTGDARDRLRLAIQCWDAAFGEAR